MDSKTFVVPVIITISGHILIEADSAEEAFAKADGLELLPDDLEDTNYDAEIQKDEIYSDE